jgi:hypothetical protein
MMQTQLKELTGKEAIFLKLDLARLDAVTAAANEFKRQAQIFRKYGRPCSTTHEFTVGRRLYTSSSTPEAS